MVSTDTVPYPSLLSGRLNCLRQGLCKEDCFKEWRHYS